jgi:hypothetical protein
MKKPNAGARPKGARLMPKFRTDKRTTVKPWDISQSNHYYPNSLKRFDDCGGSNLWS